MPQGRREPLDVRPPAREDLAALTHIQAQPPDHVGHERVTRDEVAVAQGERERVEVRGVAGAGDTRWVLALHRLGHPAPDAVALLVWRRQAAAAGQLAQELEQLQVGPRRGLALVHL